MPLGRNSLHSENNYVILNLVVRVWEAGSPVVTSYKGCAFEILRKVWERDERNSVVFFDPVRL